MLEDKKNTNSAFDGWQIFLFKNIGCPDYLILYDFIFIKSENNFFYFRPELMSEDMQQFVQIFRIAYNSTLRYHSVFYIAFNMIDKLTRPASRKNIMYILASSGTVDIHYDVNRKLTMTKQSTKFLKMYIVFFEGPGVRIKRHRNYAVVKHTQSVVFHRSAYQPSRAYFKKFKEFFHIPEARHLWVTNLRTFWRERDKAYLWS